MQRSNGSMKALTWSRAFAVCVLMATANGCSICCYPYLEDYAAFSSRYPRMDMKNGRVGSVFSDPHLVGGQPQLDVPAGTIPSTPMDETALPLDSIQIESSQIGVEIDSAFDESIR